MVYVEESTESTALVFENELNLVVFLQEKNSCKEHSGVVDMALTVGCP